MKRLILSVISLCGLHGFGQISKTQLFELMDKGIDESIIVSMVQTNCVDFPLTGDNVVELSERVSPDIMKNVVDCLLQSMKSEKVEASQIQQRILAANETVKPLIPAKSANSANTFAVPSFAEVEFDSPKSSFKVERAVFRVDAIGQNSNLAKPLQFEFSGDAKDESKVRWYRKRGGPEKLEPGEYLGYLYIVSSRKTGFARKRSERTDLHHFRVEYKGPGPIEITYFSKEKKVFGSDHKSQIEVHGPLSFFGEEHISVEGDKSMSDILNIAQSAAD